MTDDFFQLALAAMRHQLDHAGADYQIDDGELTLAGHRLGVSVTFDGFVEQAGQVIAPLEIQLHLDGDEGNKFRMGTLGIGHDAAAARQAAVAEWHLLVAAPVLAALGAPVSTRRTRLPPKLAGWNFFPGRLAVRGKLPPDLDPSAAFYRSVLEVLRAVVSSWPDSGDFALRSICLLVASSEADHEIQAAIDGMVDTELARQLSTLAWPRPTEAYLYKQLFVLRNSGD
ncbi:MAG TPA: DUF6348 family protein [Pirellulales bacterium]|nr:DUF6348 family protein [Pirellulales bacterium]